MKISTLICFCISKLEISVINYLIDWHVRRAHADMHGLDGIYHGHRLQDLWPGVYFCELLFQIPQVCRVPTARLLFARLTFLSLKNNENL